MDTHKVDFTDLQSHRATNVDSQLRLQKLQGFVQPIQRLWQTPDLESALSSFGNFCEMMYLSNTRDYLVSRHVHDIPEWGLYQLDAEGQAVQKQLEERLKVSNLHTALCCALTENARHYRLGPQSRTLLAQQTSWSGTRRHSKPRETFGDPHCLLCYQMS